MHFSILGKNDSEINFSKERAIAVNVSSESNCRVEKLDASVLLPSTGENSEFSGAD